MATGLVRALGASYLDFEIQVDRASAEGYPVSILRSPAGEARGTMRLSFEGRDLLLRLKDIQIALLRSASERRTVLSSDEEVVRSFGAPLFESLLGGDIGRLYSQSAREAELAGKGLRIKLRIQAPELAALPWEFLYDHRESEYISLSRSTPLIRYMEMPQPPQPLRTNGPLRVLGMVSTPRDLGRLDAAREKRKVEEATGSLRGRLLDIEWLEHATWRELQRALRSGQWHILHFVGHGGFDPDADEGFIVLEDDRGSSQRLTATKLGRLLADHDSLRLVVLNSCEGARGGDTDLFSSTASILLRRGLPAVLAMQYEVSDSAAIEFSRAFYETLAEGFPVDRAVTEARIAVDLAADTTVEWGTPVLFMRSPDGVLFALDGLVVPPRAAPVAAKPPAVETRPVPQPRRGATPPVPAAAAQKDTQPLEPVREPGAPGVGAERRRAASTVRNLHGVLLALPAAVIAIGLSGNKDAVAATFLIMALVGLPVGSTWAVSRCVRTAGEDLSSRWRPFLWLVVSAMNWFLVLFAAFPLSIVTMLLLTNLAQTKSLVPSGEWIGLSVVLFGLFSAVLVAAGHALALRFAFGRAARIGSRGAFAGMLRPLLWASLACSLFPAGSFVVQNVKEAEVFLRFAMPAWGLVVGLVLGGRLAAALAPEKT